MTRQLEQLLVPLAEADLIINYIGQVGLLQQQHHMTLQAQQVP
jgi:hypothetical protein